MSYKINLRFRRFGWGTGQITGLIVYYIAFFVPEAPGGSSIAGPQYLLNSGLRHKPATISPCTIAMDHDAIICFMTDRLARGPDQDVHAPSVGSTKVPFSWCRCHILVVDYRWGSMGSDETATATTGAPLVIDVLTGDGAPSGPNYLLFVDADRLADSLWDRSGVG